MSGQEETNVILIATSNPGKVREISAEFASLAIKLLSLADLPALGECEETGESFEANAVQKAQFYARACGQMTLAEDSGLEVDPLGGAPGVRSARYAGKGADDAANNAKLVKELTGVPLEKRTARFRCVMVLCRPSGQIVGKTEGAIEGLILDEARGENGFGYDPHFLVPPLGKTTAEMSPAAKNAISHRGQAARKMKEIIARQFGR